MAHSRTAKKAVRKSAARELRNRAARSAARTKVKKLRGIFESGDAAAAAAEHKNVARMLDKAAQKGILKKNTVSRLKGRLAKSAAAVSKK